GVSGLKVVGPNIFTPEVMRQMGDSLDKAEHLCAGNENLSRRIAMIRQMYTETEESLAAIKGK
ncbi:MAG: hypothetical protein U9Q07_07645, partial [Planctomycetota bacterium]|nr:hypothetical protein [Planctomycetota bacterium]